MGERGRYKHRKVGAAKRVRVEETGDVYPNVRVCAEAIDGGFSHVYQVLRGEKESYRGLTFRYVD